MQAKIMTKPVRSHIALSQIEILYIVSEKIEHKGDKSWYSRCIVCSTVGEDSSWDEVTLSSEDKLK